jgi:hypothetical protein
MRNIIKKILKEMKFESNTPDWVEKFHNLPTEERIEFIEKKKKYIEKYIPRIIEFFEEKYGDYIDRVEVGKKGVYYGSENYSTKEILLKFYFNNNITKTIRVLRLDVIEDLQNFFNIDLGYYGVPLDLEFYIKTPTGYKNM